MKNDQALIGIIKNVDIFSGITDELCKLLIANAKRFSIESGTILFNQGDISDGLYFVLEGTLVALLDVEGASQYIGRIFHGEIVGELGGFSTKPRSLTVKALENTELLYLNDEVLLRIFKEHASTALYMNLIKSIINRSQSVIKILAHEKTLRHVAIIPGNANIIPKDFFDRLKEQIVLRQDVLYVDEFYLNSSNFKNDFQTINNLIKVADKQNKTILFVITVHWKVSYYLDLFKSSEMEIILKNIDAIFVVAEFNQEPSFSQQINSFFESENAKYINRKELILIHKDSPAYKIKNTLPWLQQIKFSMHHHVFLEKNKDYQRLVRFIMGEPNALVISGGGVKGWAALGVIKGLEEKNIPIDLIAGTSVGALVASGYAATLDYKKCYEIATPLVEAGHKAMNILNLTYPIVSLTNGRLFTNALKEIYGELRVEDLLIQSFSITSNLNAGKEVCQKTGLVWHNLRASASLPLIFPPVVIEGEIYVDGGVLNNFPVDEMRRHVGKKGFIFAIDFSDFDASQQTYEFPMIMPMIQSIMTKLNLAKKKYTYPPLFELVLKALLLGSSNKTAENSKEADVLIKPDLASYPMLGLKPSSIDKLIQIGYESAIEAISQLPQKF